MSSTSRTGPAGTAPLTASDRMAYPRQFRTPRELSSQVSEPMDAAITRAMALACDDRWPDARAMASALAAGVPQPAAVPLPTAPTPTGTQVMEGPQPEAEPAQATVRASAPQSPSAPGSASAPQTASAPVRKRRAPLWRWALGGVGALVAVLACVFVVAVIRRYQQTTAAPTPGPTSPALTAAATAKPGTATPAQVADDGRLRVDQIGRASGRERVVGPV